MLFTMTTSMAVIGFVRMGIGFFEDSEWLLCHPSRFVRLLLTARREVLDRGELLQALSLQAAIPIPSREKVLGAAMGTGANSLPILTASIRLKGC